MKRVLHVLDGMFASGGIPHTVWNLTRALRDYTEWTPAILTGRYPNLKPLLKFENDRTIEHEIMPIWQPFGGRLGMTLAYPPGFRRQLRTQAEKAAVVHLHGLWTFSTWVSGPILRAMQKPYILAPRGTLEPWALAHKGLKKRIALALFERRNLNRAAVLQATSDMEQASLRSLGLVAPIVNIPNGLDPDALNYFERNLTHHVQFGPSDDSLKTVLFVSRLHPKKRVVELVKSFAGLGMDRKDWRLVIVGSESQAGYRRQVEQTISACGLTDCVQLLGHLQGDDLWRVYLTADLFVLPTLSENFGNVIIEALGAGLPVITTRGAPWNELESAHCGWWVGLEMQAFERAMKTALRLPAEARREMGQRGRELVRQKYTWQSIARQLSRTYEAVAAGQTGSTFLASV